MKRFLKDFLSISIYFVIVLIATYLLIQFVGQRTVVVGSSMEPTLTDGDNLIVDKVTYRFHEPDRYDVIVFPSRQSEKSYYIKRVIGLPGEKVYINEMGEIFIDEKKLEENFGKEPILNPGMAGDTVHLGGDEFFVLGDNRNSSADSRDPLIGVVKREDISGRAWIRMYPFSSFGTVKHE